MKAVALPPLPIDMNDYFLLTGHLTPKQRGVWLALRCHVWQHGSLPRVPADLAAVGGVHPRAWIAMEPVLQPLFDQDEAGGWHDFELEAERTAVLARRARLAKQGSTGAQNRWQPRLVEGETAMATAMATAMQGDAESETPEMADAIRSEASSLASHGPTDGLSSLKKEENSEITDGQADGRAEPDAIGRTDGQPPVAGAVDPSLIAPHAMAPAIAPAMPDPMAGAMAGAMPPANGRPSDDEIIGELRKVSGGKIEASLLTPSAIAPLKTLLEDGCDFMRDILPALQATLPGLRTPLRSFQAKFLKEASLANRDAAVRASRVQTAQSGKFFATVDSPEWRAWSDHARANGRPGYTQVERAGKKGWWFDTQWPPGSDPARYAAPGVAAE